MFLDDLWFEDVLNKKNEGFIWFDEKNLGFEENRSVGRTKNHGEGFPNQPRDRSVSLGIGKSINLPSLRYVARLPFCS